MSWSLSVTENSKADALRVFDNTLIENTAHIPDQVRGLLSDAAKNLADTLPSTGHKITLSTAGHVGRTHDGKPDNTGNMTVSMMFSPAHEDVPNVRRQVETVSPEGTQAPSGAARSPAGFPKVTQDQADAVGDPGAANASYGTEPTAPTEGGVESLDELPRRS